MTSAVVVAIVVVDVHVVALELPKMRTPMMENIEDAARQYYNSLSEDLKRQYPRQDVEKYFKNLGTCMRGMAEVCVHSVMIAGYCLTLYICVCVCACVGVRILFEVCA